MKFIIKHEIRGRMRVHLLQNRMTFEQADTLLYYLSSQKLVTGLESCGYMTGKRIVKYTNNPGQAS